MNREMVKHFSNLEQGSAARGANIERARAVFASREVTIESPITESRRGFSVSRLATLPLVLAIAAAGLMDARPVSADSNQPALVKDSNGNTTVLAPFNEAGSVVDFYSPQGLEVCGNFYPGPFVLTAVANESGMGLNAVGRPEAYADIDLSEAKQTDYNSRAHNADRAMRAKRAGVMARLGQVVRGMAVILTRDAVGQQSCGLVSDTDTEGAVAVVPPVAPVAKGPETCADGELILVHEADLGNILPRTPVGEAERVDIVEVSWPGKGFGGYDRAIIVTPRKGPVWGVNVKSGAKTVAARGFCGSNGEVAAWAVKAHVSSLQQASRDENGNQPSPDEIGVYLLNYEKAALIAVKAASQGPDSRELLTKLDVSFHEGGNSSNVPLHAE